MKNCPQRIRSRCCWYVLAWALPGLTPDPAAHAAPTVELTVGGEPRQGRPVAHDRRVCWLAHRDGRIERIALSDVGTFRKVSETFQPAGPLELRDEFRRRWGGRFEIVTRGQYVVCAPPGRARDYAELLDRVQRSFRAYSSRRGFQLDRLEFPLAVLIFPDAREFFEYVRSEEMPASPMLRGYYHVLSNQIVLYDSDRELARSTLIHEAIHQLAFNVGLHSRTGKNPRWIVEGLATMLEVDGTSSTRNPSLGVGVNRERLDRFREFRAHRREHTLADFLADDESRFRADTLDGYAEAWALTYFLAETRPSDYFRYLRRVAARDPLADRYPPEERLKDFQAAFDTDLNRLEVQFQRFIDGLALTEQGTR